MICKYIMSGFYDHRCSLSDQLEVIRYTYRLAFVELRIEAKVQADQEQIGIQQSWLSLSKYLQRCHILLELCFMLAVWHLTDKRNDGRMRKRLSEKSNRYSHKTRQGRVKQGERRQDKTRHHQVYHSSQSISRVSPKKTQKKYSLEYSEQNKKKWQHQHYYPHKIQNKREKKIHRQKKTPLCFKRSLKMLRFSKISFH